MVLDPGSSVKSRLYCEIQIMVYVRFIASLNDQFEKLY